MTSQQISKIVANELSERDSFTWPIDWADRIEEFIVEPFEGNFFNPETQEFEDFWVIANLEPDSLTQGHLIIYDVETDLFGLANKGELFDDGSGDMIGLYGTIAISLENIPL